MSLEKTAGYVVMYPNPPYCHGLDQFLRVDSTGAQLAVSTNCCSLDQATLFVTRGLAETYAKMHPVAGREAHVSEVQRVTQLVLVDAPAKMLNLQAWIQEKTAPPANSYNAKLGLPDGAIPMGRDGDAIASDAHINKGWPTPAAIDYEVTLVDPPEMDLHITETLDEISWADSNNEPSDGHAQ